MSPALGSPSISPSSEKPAKVVSRWMARYHDKMRLADFAPATFDQLCEAHDPDYVQGVLDCELPNGFMTFDRAIANSLPLTCGSMLAAARYALERQAHACSPTSGFHHAGYSRGGGFCTFNGLAMAAIILAKEGARVGIIDSDAHYGDGTADILTRHKGIKHRTWGQDFMCGVPVSNADVFEWHTDACTHMQDCDVVLYQAGADPHINDPLGGMMSDEAFAIREAVVFGALDAVAWNLAGGYQRDDLGTINPVLEIHDLALLEACA